VRVQWRPVDDKTVAVISNCDVSVLKQNSSFPLQEIVFLTLDCFLKTGILARCGRRAPMVRKRLYRREEIK
jgi:hypothetical protein